MVGPQLLFALLQLLILVFEHAEVLSGLLVDLLLVLHHSNQLFQRHCPQFVFVVGLLFVID